MASRRLLKKNVNYIADVMLGMCLLDFSQEKDGNKSQAYAELVKKTCDMRKEMIKRISHTEPGNVKGFYKKLHEDFNQKTEEVFNALVELSK